VIILTIFNVDFWPFFGIVFWHRFWTIFWSFFGSVFSIKSLIVCMLGIVTLLFSFWSSTSHWRYSSERVFLFLLVMFCIRWSLLVWHMTSLIQTENVLVAPKKGRFRRSRRQFIDEMNHDGFNFSRPNWSGANIGPRYSLSTLTIGNTYVLLLIIHYPLDLMSFLK
jgi:hypothetical protein